MRYWGVHYDTGVRFQPERLSVAEWDLDLVRYEVRAAKEQLHCNAIRIVGEDLERLRLTAETAVEQGLTVFLNPWLINRGVDELVPALGDAAKVAEELRAGGGDVVFVVGCEQSLFARGILPPDDLYERIDWLAALRRGEQVSPSVEVISRDLDRMLARSVDAVRSAFGGDVTYAAGTWEQVDWSRFDIVGLDYYRHGQSDADYAQGLRAAASHGKPVGVLEVGCCAYEGADQLGGFGWTALDGGAWKAGTPPVRNESTQARYLQDQLDIYLAEEVDNVFIFTFSTPYLFHDPDNPEHDRDMANYGLTKTFPPDTPRGRELPPWEPKESFRVVGEYYARFAEAASK